MYNLRMSYPGGKGPIPGDFRSETEENAWFSPKTPEHKERVSAETFSKIVKHNFYLDKDFPNKEPKLSPKNIGVWIELTGPSASGKHVIASHLEEQLRSKLPENDLVTDTRILKWAQSSVDVKDQIAFEVDRIYDAESNAGITTYAYYTYLLRLTEHTHKEKERTNVVSTWGALSTWNVLAYHSGKELIQDFIEKHNLKTAIWGLDSIAELSQELTQGQLDEGIEIMSNISNLIRESSPLDICPLLDTPRGIVFVGSLSLEMCEKNRQLPLDPKRSTPRRWAVIDPELQLQIRLVDSMLLRLCPENIIPINSIPHPDFGQEAVLEILKQSQSILEKYKTE